MLTNPFCAALGWALATLPTQVLLRKGTHAHYCERDGTRYLHVHRAVKPTVAETLVFVHGGGGQRGTAASWDWVGKRLSSHGMTTAVISYPLCCGPAGLQPDAARRIVRETIRAPPALFFATLAPVLVCVVAGVQPSLGAALMCIAVFLALMLADEIFWKRVYPRWMYHVVPDDLQTPGTTFDTQVQTVVLQLQAVHKQFPGKLVIIGHEHGALLAQQALKRLQPDYVAVFVSVAGFHDAAALDEAVCGWSQRFLRATYLRPVFGAVDQMQLRTAMQREVPLPDSVQVVIIIGAGSSSALIAQADHLCHALNTCTSGHCTARRHCANPKHPRRQDPIAIGPMGMGTGAALLMDTSTVFAIRRFLTDSLSASQ